MKKLIGSLLVLALILTSFSCSAEAGKSSRTLVVFFSATGTTRAVAEQVSDILGADLYEILPEQPYTEADLAYYTGGRCDQEQDDPSVRPGIASEPIDIEPYGTILIGYPIWHGQAPRILYTLLEGIDVSGKTIIPFCTSASSGAGSSAGNLEKAANGGTWLKAARISNHSTAEQIQTWALSVLAETAE